MSFLLTICPVSELSNPAMILRIDVLPVPFLATKAIFWSLLIPKDMSSNKTRSP